MSKSIISEGKTTNEAIENGLKELKVSKNKVEIKVLEEKKKKSFFSILDPNIVKVELTVKENNENNYEKETAYKKEERKTVVISEDDLKNSKDKIEKFLDEFLKQINNEIKKSVKISDNGILVKIEGEDSTILIGYRGETLNSLQTILNNIANRGKETNIKVLLDIGNYRETREKTLEELAEKIEKNVIKTGKDYTLEPMSAYERKIIHTKLQESQYVKTYSIGENMNRRVVIAKK